MSRYYFDLENGDGKTLDEEGIELADHAGAIKEASRIVTDLACDGELNGSGNIRLTIRKSDGNILGVTSLIFDTQYIDHTPVGES
ncbi:DUF6894 family protein [Phyllobacterium lublinensis]|uniref:DUF6894 family protein n=1 Tax=Phyllobacterium lublinensis TaxID=2875708 RepID=UPI001CCCB932|nr:hypothetical protein [Phyllobacterium sp. 2063]MBZ9653575.1 hypothetical protein [Phyllobacterium sp. 2063]